MTETKWTPGPWVVHGATNGRGISYSVGQTESGLGHTVARIPYNPRGPEITRTNANLIAAAPELYEALAALIHADYPFAGIYDERKFIEHLHVENAMGNPYAPLMLTAIAALAKARGEQP